MRTLSPEATLRLKDRVAAHGVDMHEGRQVLAALYAQDRGAVVTGVGWHSTYDWTEVDEDRWMIRKIMANIQERFGGGQLDRDGLKWTLSYAPTPDSDVSDVALKYAAAMYGYVAHAIKPNRLVIYDAPRATTGMLAEIHDDDSPCDSMSDSLAWVQAAAARHIQAALDEVAK